MNIQQTSGLFSYLIAGCFLICLSNCKNKSTIETGQPVEVIFPGLDPAKLSKLLVLKASDSNYRPEGIFDDRFADTLKKFYVTREGNPVWLNFIRDSALRNRLLQSLSETGNHGLNPKFYNGVLIEKMFKTFENLKEIESDQDYQFLTDLDYVLSMSVISIYKDLALGRIDPHQFYKPLYDIPFTRGNSFRLFSVLHNPLKFQDSIAVRMPNSRRYRTLQVMHAKYVDYLSKNTIKDYDTSQNLNSEFNSGVINQRLEMLWSSISPSKKIDIDSDRETYVEKTRQLYKLPPGGIDSIFVNRICVPSENVLDEILASLERERWFSVPDTGAFVLVNLNEFIVYMQGDSVKSMKVCVGKSKPSNYAERMKEYYKTKNYRIKPIDTETPQIGSKITEIILNPTWTVPNSIIGKEMYAQIISNPAYLSRKGFEVLSNGKVVSPSSINWKQYKPYAVPVKIRQKAGNSNSLGLLKFNFPNRHNIYLHDTPEKGKFNQNYRAVSHGCIRLNHPPEMAEFLLSLQGDSSIVDNFRLKIGLQPYDTALQIADSLLKPIKNTETIRLKRSVPVYLDYRTILIERNGEIRFAKDIYRKNEALAKKLKG